MQSRSLSLLGLILITAGCKDQVSTQPNVDHCTRNGGDQYCAERFPAQPYCISGVDECSIGDRDGCVAEVAPECHAPCGDPGDDSCAASGTSSESGSDTTASDTGSGSSGSSSTTGPMPCVGDEDCTDADAPFCGTTGECGTCEGTIDSNAACAGVDEMVPLCVEGACVACTAADPLVCDEQLLLCDDATNSCVPCDEHAHCESGACQLAVGTCFPPDAVVHVDGDGGQDFMTVVAAVNAVAAEGVGVIIVHEQDSGLGYTGALIDGGKTLALFAAAGESPIVQGTGGNPGLRVEGAGTALYVDGLEVSLAAMSAVGVRVDGALAWLDRSRIVQNSGGGIVAQSGAELTLRNSFVGGNGSGLAGSYGLDANGADVSVLYSTIARNDEATIDSIRCTAATVDVRNSIVVGRDADSIECPGITIANSALDENIGTNTNVGAANAAWFLNAVNDFHLTPMGAATFADIAQWTTGDPPIDIDADLRPAIDGTADYAGADVP